MFDNYKQYLDKNFTITAYKYDHEDVVHKLKSVIENDVLYEDDFFDMEITILDFNQEYNLGDYVYRVSECPEDFRRSLVFNDYVHILCEGPPDSWKAVQIDIDLKCIRITYLRFKGDNATCNGYEVIEIKGQPFIRVEALLDNINKGESRFVISSFNDPDDYKTDMIIDENRDSFCARNYLAEDSRGFFKEVMRVRE